MTFETDMQVAQQRLDTDRKQRFAEWLNQPIVRAMISLIPEGQHPDHVRLVLESAFYAGFDAGFSSMALEILRRAPLPK